MNTKLTLTLEDGIIIQAKKYAIKHKSSLSKLIERLLLQLLTRNSAVDLGMPVTRELSGILSSSKMTKIKDERFQHLIKKYSR
jgi:hypothetical protein